MPVNSQFSIVQCVPDPIAGERVNIGVIVFGSSKLYARFLTNWRRVQRFAGEPVDYAKDFAESVQAATRRKSPTAIQPGLLSTQESIRDRLQNAVGSWGNSIQFTPIRASLEEPAELLVILAETYLKDDPRTQVHARSKVDVLNTAITSLEEALNPAIGAKGAHDLIRREITVPGRLRDFVRYDWGVKNGEVYALGQTMSFETSDFREMERTLDIAIYSLGDQLFTSNGIRRSLVAAPPVPGSPRYQDRVALFRSASISCQKVDADFVPEAEAQDWARDVAQFVVAQVPLSVPLESDEAL